MEYNAKKLTYTQWQILQETERVKDARRLHGFAQVCVICGRSNPRCLELHHLPERGYGDERVPLCRNCHRTVTDRRNNKPAPPDPSKLDVMGQWLLALAQFLLELARNAFEFGMTALEAAKRLPPPFGNLGMAS